VVRPSERTEADLFRGVQVTVQFAGRKGRRGRIKIEAPAGAVLRAGRD
jgi:hypothetical protein